VHTVSEDTAISLFRMFLSGELKIEIISFD